MVVPREVERYIARTDLVLPEGRRAEVIGSTEATIQTEHWLALVKMAEAGNYCIEKGW